MAKRVSESDKAVSSVADSMALQGETVQRLDDDGAKRTSDTFTPEDSEERLRLPAGRVGGTQWGSEYCVVCFHI